MRIETPKRGCRTAAVHMAAKERLLQLIGANAPVFYMHPRDHFMPCSVDWFMHHSELQQALPEGKHTVVLERGQVNAAALAAAHAAAGAAGGQLQLSLDVEGRLGYPKDLIDDVPLYVNAKEVVGADGRAEALELNYLTFFAHNGPYSVAGFKVGAHDGDWEHITARLDAATGATLGMYFHAHRNHDGMWVAGTELPRDRDGSGRPAAFVALHGHGTYPAAGRQLRAMLFANDLCSDRGPVWRPRRCVLLPHIVETDGSPAKPGPAQPDGARRLMRVPSRGTSLNSAAAAAAISAAAAVARPAGRPAANSLRAQPASHVDTAGGKGGMSAPSSAAAAAQPAGRLATNGAWREGYGSGSGGAVAALQTNDGPAMASSAATGVEVVEDAAEWLAFTGRWGTLGGGTPSPVTQRWFRAAEPPVSRSLLRRVLHFPPEQRLGSRTC